MNSTGIGVKCPEYKLEIVPTESLDYSKFIVDSSTSIYCVGNVGIGT
jgi:hypothetical protein